jgi:hypothetical protein
VALSFPQAIPPCKGSTRCNSAERIVAANVQVT